MTTDPQAAALAKAREWANKSVNVYLRDAYGMRKIIVNEASLAALILAEREAERVACEWEANDYLPGATQWHAARDLSPRDAWYAGVAHATRAIRDAIAARKVTP
jgi:hypothetical protein